MRLPRFAARNVSSLVVLAAVSALPVIAPSVARAQDATPAAAAPAAGDSSLRKDVENFWHYGKIGKYDLSADAANKVLTSGKDPVEVLKTFEAIAEDSKDKIDVWMLRWQNVDKLREPTAKLITMLDEGRRTRRADPAWIETNIKALSLNQRSYFLALERIRDSGELAIPQMLDYLRDSSKAQYHGAIRQAMKDMGQLALNPLVAATEMKDEPALISVINSIAEIGYASTVPYLARLSQNGATESIKNAAKNALTKMGVPEANTTPAGDQYFDLSESFYYDKSAIRADSRNPEANVWQWDEAKGLQRTKIPLAIFNDVMAMRTAKTAMKLDTKKDALSLYLVANYKREVQLGDGKDATTPDGTPSAHYYGVASGTQFVNAALARALADGDAPVALKVTKSLEEIVGRTNLLSGPHGEALSEALRFNDRQVRFEAAFAVAAALPNQPFAAQDRVVPLLAEAVHQTGAPGILVLYPSNAVNAKVDELRGAGYNVVGAGNAEGVVAAASQLPAVDVILTTDEVSGAEIQTLFAAMNNAPRTERAAKIIVSKTMTASTDPSVTYTPLSDAAGLKPVIEGARAKTGGVPMDDKIASAYALRAADLLGKLAINGNKVLDVTQAQSSLMASLEDTRPEVVKAVANVLALLNDKSVQSALATKAGDEKAADEVKVALFKALATNAKNNGNLLDADGLAIVQKTVAGTGSLEVRSAAAEARGALNLPAEQSKTLIIGQ